MLEEPTRSGELVTAPPDLTPRRTGRPHPQELRSRVVTPVLGGASSRQAAARYGERQRGVDVGATLPPNREHRCGDRRSRLKGERDWLPRRVAAAPHLTRAQLHEELRARGIRGCPTLRRFLKKGHIEVR